jgi:hypothetical protein
VTWPLNAAHRDYIVEQLAAGVTVSTIHQRLADERRLAVSVASVRRYVATSLPEEVRPSQVRVLRLVPDEARALTGITWTWTVTHRRTSRCRCTWRCGGRCGRMVIPRPRNPGGHSTESGKPGGGSG